MCHAIKGTNANAVRAPDLTHVASRRTLGAGVIPNTAEHRAAWVGNAQAIKPGTNMPPQPLPPARLRGAAGLPRVAAMTADATVAGGIGAIIRFADDRCVG